MLPLNKCGQCAPFGRRTVKPLRGSPARCRLRYMPMKIAVIILLSVIGSQTFALKCAPYTPPKGESIALTNNDGVYAFSLPSHMEGFELQRFSLFVYSKKPKQKGVIAAPIAFKFKNGTAVGEFAILSKDVEAEVSAEYIDEMCGPRLERSVSI